MRDLSQALNGLGEHRSKVYGSWVSTWSTAKQGAQKPGNEGHHHGDQGSLDSVDGPV